MAEQTNRDADDTAVGQQRPSSADEATPTTPGVTGADDDSDAPATTKDDEDEDERDEVDEASEESFPASDPPAWTGAAVDSH